MSMNIIFMLGRAEGIKIITKCFSDTFGCNKSIDIGKAVYPTT
jgi:hypothetical protein